MRQFPANGEKLCGLSRTSQGTDKNRQSTLKMRYTLRSLKPTMDAILIVWLFMRSSVRNIGYRLSRLLIPVVVEVVWTDISTHKDILHVFSKGLRAAIKSSTLMNDDNTPSPAENTANTSSPTNPTHRKTGHTGHTPPPKTGPDPRSETGTGERRGRRSPVASRLPIMLYL